MGSHEEVLISTDNRGRMPLTKVLKDVEPHYLVRVAPNGIVTLTPAVVRSKIIDEALAIDPDVIDEIEKQIAQGERGEPSATWESIKNDALET